MYLACHTVSCEIGHGAGKIEYGFVMGEKMRQANFPELDEIHSCMANASCQFTHSTV